MVFKIPLEPGEREKGKSVESNFCLSGVKRSELIANGFSQSSEQALQGGFSGVPFLWLLSFGQAKKVTEIYELVQYVI
jgi:hypothetical protein